MNRLVDKHMDDTYMWEAQTGQCFLWSSGSSTFEVMEGCGRLTTFLAVLPELPP